MRVVQLVWDFGLGGIQKGGILLAKGLGALGVDSYVVGRRGGARFVESEKNRCTMIICGEGIANITESILALDPDVIHIHAPDFEIEIIQALAKISKARLVITPVFGRPCPTPSVIRNHTVCCVGKYTHYRYCRWTGTPPSTAFENKIVYAPITSFEQPLYGQVDGTARDELASRMDAKVVFGRIGRPSSMKWHNEMPKIVETLLRANESYHWLSVGWPDDLEREELMQRWGNRFCDYREIADYETLCKRTREIDIIIFASRFGECFSSSICEAASLGVPVVALLHPLRDAGECEQIISGETGLMAWSVGDLLTQAIDLAQDRELRGRLSIRARLYARAHWSIESVSARLLPIYSAVCNDSLHLLANHPWQKESNTFVSEITSLLVGRKYTIKSLLLRILLPFYFRYRFHRLARGIMQKVRGAIGKK